MASLLKDYRNWEDYRPYESQRLDNRFEGINLSSARHNVAHAFQAFADMAAKQGTIKVIPPSPQKAAKPKGY